MRLIIRSLRARWIVAVLVLALAGVGGAGVFALALTQPHPERYASGVLFGDAAQNAILSNPVARTYLRDFHTQASFSSCGPSSLLNLLASIGAPIASESTLFDGKPWDRLSMQTQGMTLDDLADLVAGRHIGAVTLLRDLSYAAFLDHLQHSNSLDNRYIVNFDRAPIFGVSVGHFSPIGGYDAATDLVALLDVTPGFGPSLVPSQLLYAGVRTKDPTTGRARGLLRISDLAANADQRAGQGKSAPSPVGPAHRR